MRLGRGRLLGRYRLLQLIRRGRRTELYRAERSTDKGAPVPCAVKIPRGEGEAALEAARELSHEIEVLSQLDHPNIVRLEDHGNVAGSIFLALELLEGRSVSQLLTALSLTGGWMPTDVAAHVAAEIALALAHVHRATLGSTSPSELVHRDVRPGHVMLLRSGAVKLVDFGAARAADRRLGRRRTQLDLEAGTAAYLAPEQVAGHPVDRRADLFSLGVALWEMLAQRRLFRRESDQETATAVLEGPIPPLASLRSDIPAALEAAVRRALDRDPQRRFQTAEEMAAELGRCTPGRELMARGVALLVEATMDVAVSGSSPLPERADPERPRGAAPPPRRASLPPAPPAEKTAAVRWRRWSIFDGPPIDRSRLRFVQAGVLAALGFASGAIWQRRRLERALLRPGPPPPPPARAVVERIEAPAPPVPVGRNGAPSRPAARLPAAASGTRTAPPAVPSAAAPPSKPAGTRPTPLRTPGRRRTPSGRTPR